MLKELDLQTITLTEAASQAVSSIMAQRSLVGYALRVYLAESGCCSGLNFGMALDDKIGEQDRTFEAGGVKVVVDAVSLDYLQGAKIDFVNDPVRGAGFMVDSPSARAYAEEHSEGTCACGGSCSCNS